MNIIISIIILIAGICIGAIEENLRYSIIYHEAKKGDIESQMIIDKFDTVGAKIEQIFDK